MSGAVPAAVPMGAAPGRPSWPIRSGTVPALVDGFTARLETVPGLAAALPAGAAVALVPDRAAAPAAFPGPVTAADAQDWLRSSGKTQLAAAFAESLWQSGGVDLLVWVEATSRASVLSGYAAATAAATGRSQTSSSESVAAQFLSWLGETSRSWLVVFDDLASSVNLDGLWPAGPAGRVLVTSADAGAVPSGMPVVPVGPFSLREAIGYLSGHLSADTDKRLGAIELAHELDFEPVALAQASAVIANSPLSCREYQAQFVRRREQLAESSTAQSSTARPPAAAVTWTFSFGRADQLAPDGSAQLLLALAALLDGHGIPETVLAAPAARDFLAGGAHVPASSERARAALAALEQVGLLTVDPVTAPPTVRISPVLQAALRAAMLEGMPDQAASSVADALLQAWPERDLPGWPASGLRSCAATLRRLTGDGLWDGGCHPLLVRAGDSLDHARLTGPAVDHWGDLATTSARLLGGGHPDTMLAGKRLADAYLAAGRADDAIAWFQWVFDSLAHKLGTDHRNVIEARRRLGHALVAARRLPAGITVLEGTVPQFERVCGPGHADTLGARDELAAAYLAAGQHSDAITLYRRTLADRERVQGPRHPQTLTTRHGLAGSYLADGRSKEAVAAYKRVVADRERVLGPDHVDTLTARSDLGAAYQETGKTAAAELACEQAWAGFERVLGPRHPDTLRSRAGLAQVYSRLGRYGDARALLRDTVDRLERILPDGDPLITELRQSLADIGEELSPGCGRRRAAAGRCAGQVRDLRVRGEPRAARPGHLGDHAVQHPRQVAAADGLGMHRVGHRPAVLAGRLELRQPDPLHGGRVGEQPAVVGGPAEVGPVAQAPVAGQFQQRPGPAGHPVRPVVGHQAGVVAEAELAQQVQGLRGQLPAR
jgi:tetratricopeptide (TPR) repeat protein